MGGEKEKELGEAGRIFELSRESALKVLGSSEEGLSSEEAVKRLKKYGKNEIESAKKTPLIYRFFSNFTHLFAVLLWVASALSFISGMPELAWAIIGVIIINGIFSFVQEYKAEKATEALKKLLPFYVKVLREGRQKKVLASELVPGDVIILGEGDKVPADARLLEAYELQVDNSVLTGESRPVRKLAEAVSLKDGFTWRDLPNLIFAGTNVVSGTAKALIFATGMKTEFGKIAHLTQAVEAEISPLQKEMGFVTKVVAFLALGMGVVFYLLGTTFAGLSTIDAFIFAIGIIVANVPEGLLPTVTLALAMGVQRMAHRSALVKKLSSVETLGSCTVICTDKTGTLTQNEMTVRAMWAGDMIEVTGVGYEPKGEFRKNGKALGKKEIEEIEPIFLAGALCNNAKLLSPGKSGEERGWKILGDPTEGSLLVLAEKAGYELNRVYREKPRVQEIPFDSRRKRMSVICEDKEGRLFAWVKGAPGEIVKLSKKVCLKGEVKEFTEELKREVLAVYDSFAGKALRVLALAYREVPQKDDYKAEEVEKDLVFLGLVGMMDPPRLEVKEAVKKCQHAGIRIIMITGDYGITAEAIARKIGIIQGRARIITGQELDNLSQDDLKKVLKGRNILFARVAPEHKMRVVSALQDLGETVAVTGDGVNDAPALKKADIGVAMGLSGTDVAKEAAEMILLDDNFATIVNAIEEGRAVYDNIKRFVTYIFASNIPEIVPYLVFVLSGGLIPLPLTVLQILAIDLGTDLVPALALGTEAPELGVMEKPPRSRKDRLLNTSLLLRAYGFLGIIEATACMSGYFFAYLQAGWHLGVKLASQGRVYEKARTMCLAGVVTTQIGNGYACRTERESIFRVGFFSNRLYLWGIISELILINLFVYLPFFQKLFGHQPLGLIDWVYLFLWTPVIFFASEGRKFFVRRKTKSKMRR
jgi:magnesium-transporting ATPase (P-type)